VKDSHDLLTALVARERGRSWMRAATITAGAAGLATAGVIAYNLPAPATHKVVVISPAPPTAAPVVVTRSGEGDDGGSWSTAPATRASTTHSHTTSGGS
jgi:hypothetical protein